MSFGFWEEFDNGCKPSEEFARELVNNFDIQCQKAAVALRNSDVLVLFTGAGFSADSGLAVYADVAKVPAYQARDLDYCDICQPDWLDTDPDLFYGFWGQCFADYRKTKPHEGYNIIARWRDDKTNSREKSGQNRTSEEIQTRVLKKMELRRPFDEDGVMRNSAYEVKTGPAGAFFSFTSNVDAHFFDVFRAHEVFECHGNIETWQCSSPYCSSGVWRVPLDHHFVVEHETMLAPPTKNLNEGNAKDSDKDKKLANGTTADEGAVPHIGETKGMGQRNSLLKNMPPAIENLGSHADKAWERTSNWPKCGHCLSLARPAILMFGDFGWKSDIAQANRWSLWKEAVLDLSEKRSYEGIAVADAATTTTTTTPSTRQTGPGPAPDRTASSPLRVCIMEIGCGCRVPTCRASSERFVRELQKRGGDVTMVRVNPDFPLTNDEDIADCVIPIMSNGLEAIQKIDQCYRSLDQQEQS